jgi:CTP:molybdopterin cytidylyltransferase MocA
VSPAGGLVLAAGAGRRFGGPKQLALLDGRPVLEHVLDAMQAVPALDPLVVVLGARAQEVRAGMRFGRFATVVAEDWADGQAASLRAGVEALAELDQVLVCLGDQPRITPQVIAGTLEHGDPGADAVRAAYRGVPGHPVLLRRPVLRRVPALRGDAGARALLAEMRVATWEAGHLCDPTDIDTQAQLEAMR